MDRVRAQSYEHLADHYEHLTELGADPVATWLQEVLQPAGRTAVDLGCGAGRHAVLLAERFEHVLAVDVSEAMIELAQRTRPHPAVTYRAADLFDVDGQFDLVFSSAALHHVADLGHALAHVRQLVGMDGTVVLADVVGPSSPVVRLAHRIAPRSAYRAGAFLGLVRAVAHRDRGALRRYRLATYRPWLDHLATDRFLTGLEFNDVYGSAFPGATFIDLGYIRICRWSSPT